MIFESALQKIARAKRYAEELNSMEQRVLKEYCSGIITEVDPHTGDKTVKVKLNAALPLDCASAVSDSANNLRDALDHASYAVAVASGVADPKKFRFPFAGSADDLDNAIRGGCKDVPDDIIALFRTFKPYRGGNNLLFALNVVANTNKHKMLKPMAINTGGMFVEHMVVSGPFRIPTPRWDKTKNEIVIMEFGKDAQADYNFQLRIFIAFDEVEFVGGQPAVPVLNTFRGEVERIVSAIEAEARRIGLVS